MPQTTPAEGGVDALAPAVTTEAQAASSSQPPNSGTPTNFQPPAPQTPGEEWVSQQAERGMTWQWWVKQQFKSPRSLIEWWWRSVGTGVAYQGATLQTVTRWIGRKSPALERGIRAAFHLDSGRWEYTSRMGWPEGILAKATILPAAIIASPLVWGVGLLGMCLFKDNLVYGNVPHPISTELPATMRDANAIDPDTLRGVTVPQAPDATTPHRHHIALVRVGTAARPVVWTGARAATRANRVAPPVAVPQTASRSRGGLE